MMEEENDEIEQCVELPEAVESGQVGADIVSEILSPSVDANEGEKCSEDFLVEKEFEQQNDILESEIKDEIPSSGDHDETHDTRIEIYVPPFENEHENSSPVGNFDEEMKEELVLSEENLLVDPSVKLEESLSHSPGTKVAPKKSIFDPPASEGEDSGTEEEQAAFMKELENFFKERSLEFKPPKFYGENLNCLKLWRAVTRLGGYEQVTSCKLWRQVGESFKPPKTCTTVSWSFRCFYEKALLEYEKHKIRCGELQVPVSALAEPLVVDNQASAVQASGSGRQRRDAAARAMQGWHSQRFLGNGEISSPVVKDKTPASLPRRDKHLKSIGLFKRKKPSNVDSAVRSARMKIARPQMDSLVVDVGDPADWVKVNVRRTKDCFEIYALVPGLLREEVHVQSDPAGRLVVSGQPEQPDNPWGVTPFKKVVTLPSRIDPHQTSAVVTLHGQLFIRAPFEQS
ncbi:ARID/BRIGHT DNA-binding domain-containing protein [Wolffia australiana]